MAIVLGLLCVGVALAECDRDEGLAPRLLRHEGLELCPYRDTLGNWTVGVGHLIRGEADPEHCWTREHVMQVFRHDIERAETSARHLIPDWYQVSGNRRDILTELAFQIGAHRLSGFHRMLAAVHRGDWTRAGAELLDSKLARQTPGRARELACLMVPDV